MDADEQEPDVEQAKVWGWRNVEAVRCGLAPVDAFMFSRSSADLNQLRRLVESGCDPETAARILV